MLMNSKWEDLFQLLSVLWIFPSSPQRHLEFTKLAKIVRIKELKILKNQIVNLSF